MKQQALPPCAESITAEEWCKTHRDFKTVINGQRYVMRWTSNGTGLIPVVIVKEPKQ